MGMNKMDYLMRTFTPPTPDQIADMIVDVVISDMRGSVIENPHEVVKSLLGVYHAVEPNALPFDTFEESEARFHEVYRKVMRAESGETPDEMNWPDAMPVTTLWTRKLINRLARLTAAHDMVVGEHFKKLAENNKPSA
jgi:hypothetical protein